MTKPVLPKLGPLDVNSAPLFATHMSWAISDPERFFRLMNEARSLVNPGYYFGDNLFCWARNLSMLTDETFKQAWKNNITSNADEAILWRRYILATSAHHCVQLEGDFVECGVYNGSGVKTVMDYLGGPEFVRTFWAYDTYDYHPVEGHAFVGQEAGMYEKVCERFRGYDQVRIIKGLLPDSFAQGCPQKIAYLHIDLNDAEAEIAVLDALFDRVVSGGMVILDDYEWSLYRKQKAQEDPWFEKRDYRVMPLPTGQGLIVKR